MRDEKPPKSSTRQPEPGEKNPRKPERTLVNSLPRAASNNSTTNNNHNSSNNNSNNSHSESRRTLRDRVENLGLWNPDPGKPVRKVRKAS